MSKEIIYNEKSRLAVKRGVDKLVNAVKVTLGPKGRNVLIDKQYGSPIITKDGVTVAKEIVLKNKFENVGAKVIREAASKTNDMAGDGTTTSSVLAQAIFDEGLKMVASGINPVDIRRGMESRVAEIITNLKEISKPISTQDEVTQVASISANDGEIGKVLADAMYKIGKDGVITVEDGQSFGIETEVVEGMKLENGYLSPYMVSDQISMKSEIDNALILLTDKKISSIQEVLPLLEQLMSQGKKDLVIIADDVDGDALATFVVNKMRGALNVLAIRCPGFGEHKLEILEDIAILTGGKVISDKLGLKLDKVTLSDLGSAKRVVSSKDNTIIVGGFGDKEDINERIVKLKAEMEQTESKFDKERIGSRIAKLSGGVAVIKVGAATEAELKEKKYRIEDALNATKAAVDEGIVPGGGLALLFACYGNDLSGLEDGIEVKSLGGKIIDSAILAPFRQICDNAGVDSSLILQRIIDKNGSNGIFMGYDASRGEYVDMIKDGIVDPAKVVRCALENASSAAMMLLTTEAVIVDGEEKKKDSPDYGNMGF